MNVKYIVAILIFSFASVLIAWFIYMDNVSFGFYEANLRASIRSTYLKKFDRFPTSFDVLQKTVLKEKGIDIKKLSQRNCSVYFNNSEDGNHLDVVCVSRSPYLKVIEFSMKK